MSIIEQTTYVIFKNKYGCIFRIPQNEMPENVNIQQRFIKDDKEIWITVQGPNDYLHRVAFDAIAEQMHDGATIWATEV